MTSRSILSLWVGTAAVAVAAYVPPATTSFAAVAQVDGDEKCSPSGYVLRYRDYARGWTNTYTRCNPNGGGGGRSGDDERPTRRGSNGDGSGGARPEDGDEKCGPDGYVMKYDWSDYLKKGTWRSSLRRCSQ